MAAGNRQLKLVMPTRPARRAASAMAWPSAAVMASGFSQSTWAPPSSARSVIASCRWRRLAVRSKNGVAAPPWRSSMVRVLCAVGLLVGALSGLAEAQEPYPTRPITIVVAFPPGGVADNTARPVAAALERILKHPVVVSNKQGAAGGVGYQVAATAKPDGYTLLMALVSVSVLPEVDK